MGFLNDLFYRRPKKVYWVVLQKANGDSWGTTIHARSREDAEEQALNARLPSGVKHRDAGYMLVSSERMRSAER